jgi:hypothetical protein
MPRTRGAQPPDIRALSADLVTLYVDVKIW